MTPAPIKHHRYEQVDGEPLWILGMAWSSNLHSVSEEGGQMRTSSHAIQNLVPRQLRCVPRFLKYGLQHDRPESLAHETPRLRERNNRNCLFCVRVAWSRFVGIGKPPTFLLYRLAQLSSRPFFVGRCLGVARRCR